MDQGLHWKHGSFPGYFFPSFAPPALYLVKQLPPEAELQLIPVAKHLARCERCSLPVLQPVLTHPAECRAGPWAFVLAALLEHLPFWQ